MFFVIVFLKWLISGVRYVHEQSKVEQIIVFHYGVLYRVLYFTEYGVPYDVLILTNINPKVLTCRVQKGLEI